MFALFCLLILNVSIIPSLVILLFITLFYLALNYPPEPRKNWPYSAKETVYLVFAIIFFIAIIYILHTIIRLVGMPNLGTILSIAAIVIFVVLVVIGILYPTTFQLTRKETQKET